MARFVTWRTSQGDIQITGNAGRPRDFPYERGPQHVIIDYEEAMLLREETTNINGIISEAERVWTESTLDSTRGVDYLGQSLINSTAIGCINHFYDYIRDHIIEVLRGLGQNVALHNDIYLTYDQILAVPFNVWVEAIRRAYELPVTADETINNQIRELAARMTIFFRRLRNGGLNVQDENGVPTEDLDTVALARELKRVYTQVTYMGRTMTPLYQKDLAKFSICGIGFMSAFLYTGNNPNIIAAQDALFSGEYQGENYRIMNFTERALNPNARLLALALDEKYEDINGHDNSRVVRVRVAPGVLRIPVIPQMAVGPRTNQLQHQVGAYTRTYKYFGNNCYNMGYTEEQRIRWKDNSNSANLCGITCVLYNEVIYPLIVRSLSEEEFIGQISLTLGLYNDERLNLISSHSLIDVIHIVSRWVGRHTDAFDKIIVHKSGKDINAKYFVYDIASDKINTVSKQPVPEEGVRETTIRIYQNEGHLFNVWNEEHYNYIVAKFRKPVTKTATTTQCLFNDLRMSSYKKFILSNPHKMLELRDMWIKEEITVHAHIPRTLINELSYKYPSQEALRRFRELTGRPLKDKEGGRLAYKLNSDPVIYGYDLETIMYGERSLAYGFTLLGNQRQPIMSQSIIGMGRSDKLEIAEASLLLHLLHEVAFVAHEVGVANQAAFCEEHDIPIDEYEGEIYFPLTIVTAHNGGAFDNVIFRNNMCRDLLGFCNVLDKWKELTFHGFKFQCENDIVAGGKMKMFNVKVQGPKGDFNIRFVDSLNLLNCAIGDAAKMYDLNIRDNTKGVYPYTLYDWVINNGNNRVEFTRQELIETNFPTDVREDVDKFLNKDDRAIVNLVDLFKEYCEQDVNIMMNALNKAHEMFHSVVIPDANGVNILGPESGVTIVETNRGNSTMIRPDFITEVTLPGFAKKIAKSVVLTKGTVNYKTIANEYCKVWTGGLTYCRTVKQFISSKMREIATNPYFYLKPDKSEVITLFRRYGYDVNKQKMTYRRDNVPAEVNQLKEQLNDIGSYLVLVDANSLYPAAMYEMMRLGGFPIGPEEVIRDAVHCQELYQNNKRWIAYFRVIWTQKAIDLYARRKFPMHQLIVTTDEGNRHLRPGDNKCHSLGMTDVEYRSINETDTGLFRLEFINGIYWENTSNNLSLLMDNLYNERARLKREGSPAEKCTKLVMNATYGAMLEACHYIVTNYLDGRDDEGHKDIEAMDPVTLQPKTIRRKIAKASQYTSDMMNHGPVSDYDKLGMYYRAERVSLEKILEYPGYSYIASFILGAAKRNMNKLFHRMQFKVGYTDTDSAFMENQVFQRLMREDDLIEDPNKRMMGLNLGQFKSDLDDKFGEATKLCDVGIVSVSGVMLAKKLYCNVLLGVVCDEMIARKKEIEKVNLKVQYKDCILPEDQCYITCMFKTAGKGVVHKAIPYTTYEALVDDAVELKQDRAGILSHVFIKDGGVKTDGGIHITRINDPNRRQLPRTIKNQNAIERDRELLRVNKALKQLNIEPLPAPQRIVIEQGVLPPKPEPKHLTLQVI